MSIEHTTKQYDMFPGELVDKRTASQKRAEQQRANPQQTDMFSQRELAQYVNSHPQMDFDPGALILISEDPRTPEEIEADRERETQRLTIPSFKNQSLYQNKRLVWFMMRDLPQNGEYGLHFVGLR